MKKNTLLAIVVLVAVVVAFSFLPLSSAKKPTAPTITLGPSGVLVTVGASCDGVTADNFREKVSPVTAKKLGETFFGAVDPVAVWFDLTVNHEREHPLNGETFFLPGPGCVVADLRVNFENGDLVDVRLLGMDRNRFKVEKVSHTERFNLLAIKVDGTFDGTLRHVDGHTGRQHPDTHRDLISLDSLAITGSHT